MDDTAPLTAYTEVSCCMDELLTYLLFCSYSVSLFIEDEVGPFDPLKTVYDFIQFVDRICVVGLQVSDLTNGKDMELMRSLEVGRFFPMSIAKQRLRWLGCHRFPALSRINTTTLYQLIENER